MTQFFTCTCIYFFKCHRSGRVPSPHIALSSRPLFVYINLVAKGAPAHFFWPFTRTYRSVLGSVGDPNTKFEQKIKLLRLKVMCLWSRVSDPH
jgi:hypothetical protein